MKVTKWHPFNAPLDFFSDISQRANARWPELFAIDSEQVKEWAPSADISETKKAYVIKADLPDVEKEDMHVSVREGALLIEGERRHHDEEEKETYHRIESMYGKFSRVFTLPSDVDESGIKAEAKNGVLRVRLPKSKESEPADATEVEIN